jgi:hypothetical protein
MEQKRQDGDVKSPLQRKGRMEQQRAGWRREVDGTKKRQDGDVKVAATKKGVAGSADGD